VTLAPHTVLHVDLVLLREDLGSDAREGLNYEAAALRDLPGLIGAGVVEAAPESDFDVAFLFALDSLPHLEDFGTNPRYIRFLQGGLAQAMRSFGGADVQLQGELREPSAHAACLALAATPQTYDWQVRDALSRWTGGADGVGLAVGERQRYRGLGLMFADQPIARPLIGFEGFGVDFIAGRYRRLA
jgi:hypothetical protein